MKLFRTLVTQSGNCLWKTQDPLIFIGELRKGGIAIYVIRTTATSARITRKSWRSYSAGGCVLLPRGGLLENGFSPLSLPRSTGSVSRNVKRRPFLSRTIVDWAG